MFHPDKPIQSCKEDKLGRSGFAQHLAKALVSYHGDDCLAVGLYGPWGSGKTSIINCAKEYIEKENARKDVQEKTIVVTFNPWNFSDQNQIISQFFRCLSSELKRPPYGGNLEKTSKILDALSLFFATCTLFAQDPAVAATAAVAKTAGSTFKGIANRLSKDLNEMKRKLEKQLSQQPNKIVVVIDDIDRLNSVEVRQIFQLVKSLADFPKTIYVLAFDKDVVLKTLAKVQEGSPQDYLAKIVPVTFDVPPLDSIDLKGLLEDRLTQALGKDWPKKEWNGTYSWFLKAFFRNMRDVNRYTNTLHFSYGILKDDVNLLDLMLITVIQVRAPLLYDAIKANKWLMTGLYMPSVLVHVFPEKEKQEKESMRKEFDELFEKCESVPEDCVRELIKQLFPKYEEIYDSRSPGDGDLREWTTQRRICHRDFFDRYFQLSVPSGQLWQRDLDKTLAQADAEAGLESNLKTLQQKGELSVLLKTLRDYDLSRVAENRRKNITRVLLKTGDTLCDTGKRPLGRAFEIMGAVEPLIRSLDDLDERFDILKDGVTKSHDNLYTLVELIHYIKEYNKNSGLRPDVDTIREGLKPKVLIVGGKHLTELQVLVSERISQWAEAGRLLGHPHFSELIWAWAEWEERGRIQEIVRKATSTPGGLLTFCGGFMKSWHNDKLVDAIPEFMVNGISLGLSLDEVEQRMVTIKASPDFSSLDDHHKNVVDRVLEAIALKKGTPTSGAGADGEEPADRS